MCYIGERCTCASSMNTVLRREVAFTTSSRWSVYDVLRYSSFEFRIRRDFSFTSSLSRPYVMWSQGSEIHERHDRQVLAHNGLTLTSLTLLDVTLSERCHQNLQPSGDEKRTISMCYLRCAVECYEPARARTGHWSLVLSQYKLLTLNTE